jgi:hypothetical protein
MRLRITTTCLIDLATGETQTKATWQVEGQEAGLGPALAQAAAELLRLAPPPPPSDSPPVVADDRQHPEAREARILGGALDIRDDVEKALATRPPARVAEVLRWIRQRRSTSSFRSIPALFWSMVVKD